MMTLKTRWMMDKVLPPFWVKLRISTRKIVITKIVVEAEKQPLFFTHDSQIPYDCNIEIDEIGHLPSERLRTNV